MITSFAEIINITVTAIAISYIFTAFAPKRIIIDEISQYSYKIPSFFNWDDFKLAAMVGIPAIILHELFHKFASLILGIPAFYQISVFGLAIGVFLRAINSGLIFFLPGYVQILGPSTPLQMTIIAFAGPLANLILFAASWALLKYGKVHRKFVPLLILTKKINLWLFIFNMLPVPPLDGSKVIIGLYTLIKGAIL